MAVRGEERCPTCGSVTRGVWTRQRILEALERWVEEHGRVPAKDDWYYAKPQRPSEGTVCAKFGTWNAMLRAAGFPASQRGGRPRAFTAEQIVLAINAWKMEHGTLPKQREWEGRRGGGPTRQQVVTVFGSWNAALVAAGYEAHELNKAYRSSHAYLMSGAIRQRVRDSAGRVT